jgi:hypothetical protein
MFAIKRKAPSDDGQFRGMKMPKIKGGAFNATSGGGYQSNHADIDHSVGTENSSEDVPDECNPHRDEDNDSGVSDNSKTLRDVFLPAERRIHRQAHPVSHDTKQRFLDEQVTFIILTRDNNKPDPYGSYSCTHGPCPWPAVARLYSEKFRIGQSAVGGAAMEKRARQRREEWMAARPDYPRTIMYAEKVKTVKSRAKPVKAIAKAEDQAERVRPRYTEPGCGVRVIDFNAVPPKPQNTSFHVGGWVPPDYVRNQADLTLYFSHPSTGVPNDARELVTIELVELNGQPCGHVRVPVHDIRKTSAFVSRELEQKNRIQITLACSSKDVIDRYVQCISPERLISLPDWDIASLAELYVVATQLEDDAVRSLVLERWRAVFRRGGEFELDTNDLNCIFSSTETGDPARDFWAALLCAGGVAEQIIELGDCHEALVVILEKLVGSVDGDSSSCH